MCGGSSRFKDPGREYMKGRARIILTAVCLSLLLTVSACSPFAGSGRNAGISAEAGTETRNPVPGGQDPSEGSTRDPAGQGDPREKVREPAPTEHTFPDDPGTHAEDAPDQTPYHPSDTVRLVAVGDVLMHDRIIAAGKREDGSYDYRFIFENVKETISCADIAVVNQETILGGKELGLSGYPSFNSPFEVGDAEADAGFDIILHATNHALDRGFKGIQNCVGFWEECHPGVTYLGIRDEEPEEPPLYITECNGIKIAFLNYTYGTNGIRPPAGKEYIVDVLDRERVAEDLDRAEKEADITVVFPHWGTEYSPEVSPEQEKWTGLFLEHGADICIGTHPHVIEPLREVTDEEGHSMLVYYSLGNFVNATSGEGKKVTPRMVGGIADMCIRKDAGGKCYVYRYSAVPVVCHLTEDSAQVYFLKDYNGEMASENRICLQDPDFSYEACLDVVEQVWGPEYLPRR